VGVREEISRNHPAQARGLEPGVLTTCITRILALSQNQQLAFKITCRLRIRERSIRRGCASPARWFSHTNLHVSSGMDGLTNTPPLSWCQVILVIPRLQTFSVHGINRNRSQALSRVGYGFLRQALSVVHAQ
jgi:hypothetical protein